MKTEDFSLGIGDKAPNFSLPGVDGQTYSLDSFSKEFLVVIWTCNHCPYAKAYEGRLIALAKEFGHMIDFVAINSNDASRYPDDSFEKMKERADEKDFPYPYLFDETQESAKAYGALVTPHVYVLDRDRKMVYQGGIDDAFRSGDYNNEEQATAHYLKDALSDIGSGKEIRKKTSPVVGCSVKWKE